MIKRIAYSVQISNRVSDDEKRSAEKAIELFDYLKSQLKLISNHLDIFQDSFENLSNVDVDEVLKHRIVLRNYRDQARKNFEKSIATAHKAVVEMGKFSSDASISQIMNAFLGQMKDIEKQFNKFLGLFSNINDTDFINSILTQIDIVKKQIDEIKQLVTDRVIEHIETNILAKKWTNELVDENQNKVYEKLPMIVQLFREREQALKQ